jgi:cohesin loading factor subunit SCC2
VQSRKKGEELVEDVEESGIGRLLKILERSWRGAEDLVFWSGEALVPKKESMELPEKGKKGAKKGKGRKSSESPKKKSGSSKAADDGDDDDEGTPTTKDRHGSKGERRSSRSRSRSPTVVDMEIDVEVDDAVWTDDTLDDFARAIRSLSDAVLAIRVALALLTMTRLPKSLYSADYILSILTTLRHALDAFVFPLLEAPLESHLGDLTTLESSPISNVCESLAAAIPLVARLSHQEEMSEDIVISTIYFSLSPFFHEAPAQTGKGKKVEPTNVVARSMKGIRLASLGLIRTVFARYSDQRAWVIEEVLGNLIKLEVAKRGKGAFRSVFFRSFGRERELIVLLRPRLRNGASIHTVSALILHLVQTCPTDLRAQINTRIADHGKPKLVDVEMRESQEEAEELEDENEDDDTTSSPLVRLRCFLRRVELPLLIARVLAAGRTDSRLASTGARLGDQVSSDSRDVPSSEVSQMARITRELPLIPLGQ